MEKGLQEFQGGSKMKIHLDSLRETCKKIPNRKMLAMMVYRDSGFN